MTTALADLSSKEGGQQSAQSRCALEIEELQALLRHANAQVADSAEKKFEKGNTVSKRVPEPSSFIEATPLRFIRQNAWGHFGSPPEPADLTTAYIMACLSEIAYLRLTAKELGEAGRYKLFRPSVTAHALARMSVSIDLEAILQVADINAEMIERENFIYSIYRFGEVVVVAVRGTVMLSIRDWLIDLNVRKIPAKTGKYHKGFGEEAHQARDEDLLPRLSETRTIYFTGHSLGAAVASILAQIWPCEQAVRTPYVFASPRFGSKEAAGQSRRFGFRRPFDPVPRVPPEIAGFSHSGTEDDVIREASLAKRLWSSLSVLGFGVPHHSIEGIRKRLGHRIGDDFAVTAYMDAFKNQAD